MRPSVFEYMDYRRFLQDHLEGERKASLESFCRRAKVLTKSHLCLILQGKRNLTENKLDGVAEAFKLKGFESEYFRNLVAYNQSRTQYQKDRHLTAMMRCLPKRKKEALGVDNYAVLESWRPLVVRELARLPDFQPAGKWIAEKLKGKLTASEAASVVTSLLGAGLLAPDEKGIPRPTDAIIHTTDEIRSLAIRQYHKSCLELAKEIVNDDDLSLREFSSINFVLSPENVTFIKQKIKAFRDEISQMDEAAVLTDGKVCQLNIQFAQLSQ